MEYAEEFYECLFPDSEDFAFILKSIEKVLNEIEGKYFNLKKHLLESED